jgi:5-methylcytosine-specific restriction protein A
MNLAWDVVIHKERNQKNYSRERSADMYHSARWTRLSKEWRKSHPLCEECKQRGIIKEAEVTDHIIPYPICENFFDQNNLQSLCAECNASKGNRDKKVIEKWRRIHPRKG